MLKIKQLVTIITLGLVTTIFSANATDYDEFAKMKCNINDLNKIVEGIDSVYLETVSLHSIHVNNEFVFVETFKKCKTVIYDSTVTTKTGLELTQKFTKNIDTTRILQIKFDDTKVVSYWWFLWEDLNDLIKDLTETIKNGDFQEICNYKSQNGFLQTERSDYGTCFLYFRKMKAMNVLKSGGDFMESNPNSDKLNQVENLLFVLDGISDTIISIVNDMDNPKINSKKINTNKGNKNKK